jgi:hypothetical protein
MYGSGGISLQGGKAIAKQGFGPALISVCVISIVVVAAVSASLYHTRLIGPVIVLPGFIPWIHLKLLGR